MTGLVNPLTSEAINLIFKNNYRRQKMVSQSTAGVKSESRIALNMRSEFIFEDNLTSNRDLMCGEYKKERTGESAQIMSIVPSL